MLFDHCDKRTIYCMNRVKKKSKIKIKMSQKIVFAGKREIKMHKKPFFRKTLN